MPADASYRRVAAALRRRIVSGELVPGTPVPSRTQIVQQYGVSLGAAQRAFRVLRAEGLVEGSERHRLTVAHPPAVRILIDAAAPWPHGTGDRRLERAAAPADIAVLLDVSVGARVEREQTELLDPDGRTSHALVRYSVRLRPAPGQHVHAETVARAAAPGEAGMLGVAIGSILQVVRVVRYARDGRPAAVDELLLPADRWRVRLG
ncbi:GntR family transcriptional regulator [Embleya sp. NPDC005971]|uniref:GntR family transcriptional regulator n=1 Tax=Embleya sp. NPDC005971 TaxID=3156724 RepID=UPI0033EF2DB0